MEEIFHLFTKKNEFNQDNFTKILYVLLDFYENDVNQKFFPKDPQKDEKKVKDFIIKFLKGSLKGASKQDISIIDWKFEKGACILKVVDEYDTSKLKLEMICLDSWEMNFTPNERQKYISTSKNFSKIFIGEVQDVYVDSLLLIVEEFLNRETIKGKDDYRNEKDFNGRPQNTPGWLYGIYESALDFLKNMSQKDKDNLKEKKVLGLKINPNINPKGGFTDVGRHTGSEKRSTVYPLIKNALLAAFDYIQRVDESMEELESTFDYNILLFEVFILEKKHQEIRDPNDFIQIIHSIAKKASNLEIYDSNLMEKIYKRVERIYNEKIKEFHKMEKMELVFPELKDYKSPFVNLIYKQFDYKDDDPINIQKRAISNLSAWEGFTGNFKEIYQQLTSRREEKYLMFKIVYFESFIFKQMESLKISKDETPIFKKDEIKDLVSLLNEYRIWVDDLMNHSGFIKSKLKSHKVLIAWGVYCLIHQCCKFIFPLLEYYSIPLILKDLSDLRLSDNLAIKAFEGIGQYINHYRNGNPVVFSKRDKEESGTFDFIAKYFETDQSLKDILVRERKRSEDRNSQRYQRIIDRRVRFEEREEEIERLKEELDILEINMDEAYSLNRFRKYNQIKQELKIKRGQIKNKTDSLESLRYFSEKIYHPLSTIEKVAKIQVFFMNIPDQLLCLFNLGFLCYIDFHSYFPKESPKKKKSYNEYYSLNSSFSLKDSNFQLYMDEPPNQFGNYDIYNINSPENGVWYPDDSYSTFYWKDTSFYGCLNPFQSNEKLNLFTEKIKNQELQNLQNMIIMPEFENIDCKRANFWVGNQYLKPDDWKKNEFASFCQLRNYPLQQLEKLLFDLSERNLKLTDESFHIIIREVFYHLGPLKKDKHQMESLIWKSKLFDKEYLSNIYKIIMRYSDEIKDTPQNYKVLSILGEISGYLSQFDKEFLQLRRTFSKIAENWANRLDLQIIEYEISGDYTSRSMIVEKQHLFIGCSILTMEMGELNNDDCFSLIFKILKFHQTKPLLGETSNIELENLTEFFISKKYDQIISKITGSSLTSAVSKVRNLKPDIFNDWKCGQGYYYNILKDGSYIHVNLRNGTILLNGFPSDFLSNDILNDPLYQEVFGKRNCSVFKDEKGRFKTMYPIYGRNYTFYMFISSANSQLLVHENLEKDDYNSPTEYQLLNHQNIKNWGENLPERLKRMYSFWVTIHDGKKISVLRPKSFEDRSTHFFIDESSQKIYRVPKEKLTFEVGKLLKMKEEFDVLLESSPFEKLTKVFEKFEKKEYIHYFQTKDKTLKIEMPRFDLQFEYDKKIFKSLNFNGYKLRQDQVLNETFYNFSQYFILELIEINSVITIENPKTQVIVPKGLIYEEKKGYFYDIKIKIENDVFDTGLKYSVFKTHSRFNTLKANTIEERLQLATIFAAISSLIYLPSINRTGSEMAIELLRQCSKNAPYSKIEGDYLMNLSNFDKFQPIISILCKLLYEESKKLSFLFEDPLYSIEFHYKDAASEYKVKGHLIPFNFRSELTIEEEKSFYGEISNKQLLYEKKDIQIKKEEVKKEENIIEKYQNILQDLLERKLDNQKDIMFPFQKNMIYDRSIGKKMIKELEDSWEIARNLPKMKISNEEFTKNTVKQHFENIKNERNNLEGNIHKHIEPKSVGLKFLKLANNIPRITKEDLLKFMIQPHLMKKFNNDLTMDMINDIQKYIIIWAQLCVLEDKFERIQIFLNESNYERAIQEMAVRRNWNVNQHLHWLVFEVENRIQIRNEQYELIEQILNQPNTISQLNMGLGKTSVVIPCLFLELSNKCYQKSKDSNLVRIFLLSQIYREQYSNLHLTICASVLNRKLFQIPFNRDVRLNLKNIKKIKESLKYCQDIGGCVVLCPEYYLSIILKREEISFKIDQGIFQDKEKDEAEKVIEELKNIKNLPYYDIFDESDEILHYRKQLIYSIGSQQGLSSGIYRWTTTQELLFLIRHDIKIKELLKHVSIRNQVKYYENDQLFLLPLKELKEKKLELSKLIIDILFNNPPESLRWMKNIEDKEKVKRFVFDKNYEEESIFESDFKDIKYYEIILLLRGLLGKEILYHCLEKKYNVEYGLSKKEKKNIAVPYLGADTPSERSEFSHPDCTIIYTILSWYNYGLNRNDLFKTLAHLLKCGISTQSSIYNSWFELIKNEPNQDELKSIDSIRKIDLSNEIQLNILEKYYCKNMKTINYFLNSFVFPNETDVFEERLIASPWDLTSSKNKCGFSGTNDTSILLPITVQQRVPTSDFLKATNGHILRLILQKSEYKELKSTMINDLIDFIINEKGDALIDVGALLAGFDNEKFADKLLKKIDNKYKGVVYYNLNDNDWKFKTKDGIIWRLVNSPIKEREAFVFFDQRRCRGSDMKLEKNAKALVTINSKLKKDDFIQACGRMRGLQYGQTLILSGDSNVSNLILESVDKKSKIKVEYVIEFVLINVINTIKNGFPIFALNGQHYYKKMENSKNDIQKEISILKDLYQPSNKNKQISKLIQLDSKHEMIKLIENHIKEYGSDESINQSNQDEECEREKEKEVEKEIEVQKEFKKFEPNDEINTIESLKFEELIKYTNSFCNIEWCNTIYFSKNFLFPIAKEYKLKYDDYLQMIHYVLFDNEIIILITDREAEILLNGKLALSKENSMKLIHFCKLKNESLFEAITQIKLLSGETQYDEKEKEVIKKMIVTKESIENIRSIIIYRGNSHLLEKSELEKVCIEHQEKEVMKKEN